jgi:hypothetical protein
MAPVVGDGSNRRWQSQTKAATSTPAPPVVGRDKRRRRWIIRSLAETDNGGNGNNPSPSCRRRQPMAATGPPVVGGEEWWQPQMHIGMHRNGNGNDGSPSHWQSWTTAAMAPQLSAPVPQSSAESFTDTDESGDVSPSCRRWHQQSSAESDESSNVNDSSPSCWRRQTMAETGPPVVGRDGRRRQRQQSLPQSLAKTDDGGNRSPSCW